MPLLGMPNSIELTLMRGVTDAVVISVSTKLNGAPPEMAMTKRDADPFCARTPMKEEEVVVGAGGGLRNVVVRITDGATGHYDPPSTPATLDQSSVATVTGKGPVREIKEWQAVMDYLRALPVKNGSKLPTIPVDERANEVRAIKVG